MKKKSPEFLNKDSTQGSKTRPSKGSRSDGYWFAEKKKKKKESRNNLLPF